MKRFTGNTMTMSHFFDFYFLEALSANITMAMSANPDLEFKRSALRLKNDVDEAFVELSHQMAFRIFVYLYSASLGEARYAQGFNLPTYIKGLNGMSRQSVYQKALEHCPTDENLDLLEEVYEQNWGGSYGGKAWLNIVQAARMYGKVSNATFIDHSVDLEHNGGCVFSKSADFGFDCMSGDMRNFKRFLDFKFKYNLLEKVPSWKVRITMKVYSLVNRYWNIFTEKGSSQYIKTLLVLENLEVDNEWLKDFAVEWGNETLIKGEQSGHSRDEDEDEDEECNEYRRDTRYTVRGEHIRNIVRGKTYFVQYDGESHGCGWDSNNMKNHVRVTIEKIDFNEFGLCEGWWYCKEWLYEVGERKEREEYDASTLGSHVEQPVIGKRYITKYDGIHHRMSWIDGEMKDGKVIKVTDTNGTDAHGNDGWWYCNEWLFEVVETPTAKERPVVVATVKRRFWNIKAEYDYIFVGSLKPYECTTQEFKKHGPVYTLQNSDMGWNFCPEWLDIKFEYGRNKIEAGKKYVSHPKRGPLYVGAESMPDGEIIVPEHVNKYSGNAFYNGYWYKKEWLTEVK